MLEKGGKKRPKESHPSLELYLLQGCKDEHCPMYSFFLKISLLPIRFLLPNIGKLKLIQKWSISVLPLIQSFKLIYNMFDNFFSVFHISQLFFTNYNQTKANCSFQGEKFSQPHFLHIQTAPNSIHHFQDHKSSKQSVQEHVPRTPHKEKFGI